MTFFFSLIDANATMDSAHDTHTLHDTPARIENSPSDDLAQQDYSPSTLNQSHEDSHHNQELPPRPESRMDFVLESPNALDDADLSAQVRSHKRTPSATLRWTREILKKIRLTGSTTTSTSDSDIPPGPVTTGTGGPPLAAFHSAYSGSNIDDCMIITGDVPLMTTNSKLNSSASHSSSLSTSSSGSYPALDDISISLSSSSDFDSFEDTEGDSDSDLDSLKEIDLGDDLSGDSVNAVYAVPVKEEKTYEPSHVYTYTPVPVSPSVSPSPLSSTLPPSSLTESILESFPTDNGETDQTMLDYAPEPRTRYTCLPSPLSLFPPFDPATSSQSQPPPEFILRPNFQPQRHLYFDRGYSRHALHYRKWFWALREEDWARYTVWLEDCQAQQEAYTGMSTSPVLHESKSCGESSGTSLLVQGWQPEVECRPAPVLQGWQPDSKQEDQVELFPSLFSSARESIPNNCRQRTEASGGVVEDIATSSVPPLTIHPRWGDLIRVNLATAYSSAATCTETWCMHTDRYLLVGMGLGLWTIRKVLWLSELNRAWAIIRARAQSDEEEGETTLVVDGETKDPKSTSCPEENCSTSDESDDEDEDTEEGEVMYSSVVSLASLISTTTNSDDSDVTLVESDSDIESPTGTNSSSTAAFATQAEASCSGRSVDFDKTCLSPPLPDGDEEFEDVDLGLGCGSLEVACSSSLPPPPSRIDPESESSTTTMETESMALLRTLYLNTRVVSTPSLLEGQASLRSGKGKCRQKASSTRWGIPSLNKRSWYEQCEFLLEMTGARETLA
ncbi:hypothetical protein F5880DRAFT_1511614 [Lentinula raphanica]|nr:hypothetical protein F5880DRAFT_1511614 [Lentinula raphanica]